MKQTEREEYELKIEQDEKRIIALLERAEKAERRVKQLECGYADYLTLGGLFNPERDSAV